MKRILWISDIHLNGKDTARPSERLISSFMASLKELEVTPDFFVISGDIAKSGSDEAHYQQFRELLIEPVKSIFPEIKIICVPGNHDVNWNAVDEKLIVHVVKNPEAPDVLQSFKSKINKNYFNAVFDNYKDFHKSSSTNEASATFSKLTVIDNLAFITLNSAWLSIGNPVDKAHIESRVVNKVQSLGISNKEGTKVLFEELGNQTYGFTIPDVKKELEAIEDELIDNHKDKFKILVVHHPPNNWLHWRELYSERASEKSDFHNFIVNTGIDLILCGHEHTSLVEGGLLYGKALVLYAGMFLDHHENDYSNSWFKLLEIDDSIPQNSILNEKWYHYSNIDNGIWQEKDYFSMQYQGWQSISKRLTSVNIPKRSPKAFKLHSDADLRKYCVKTKFSKTDKHAISKLAGFTPVYEETIRVTDEKGVLLMLSDENNVLFLVNNFDDFFEEYDEKLPKKSYISEVVEKIKENTWKAIFIFYIYQENSRYKLKDADRKIISEAVQSKFDQFRHVIFKIPNVLVNLKNANFAVRKK